MFCCIGKKVKWLARLILWLGTVASIIWGIITLIPATGNALDPTVKGWLIIVIGMLASWALSWITYAIGVAAEAAERR